MKRSRKEISASPPVIGIQAAETLVSHLNQAVTKESRLRVLSFLFQQVGYNPESRSCRHCVFVEALVEAGAINALCLQLGFVLNKRDMSAEELEAICKALAILFYCSETIREQSLQQVGIDLVALLVKAIQQKNASTTMQREVVSIWHSAASCTTGVVIMSKCKGFMPSISSILKNAEENIETVTESLGLLKRLTYCAEEPRLQILNQTGMLTSLAGLSFILTSEKSKEWLSSVLRNIAATPSARPIMAQNTQVLSALVRLASHGSKRTLRNILCTLDCLLMESNCCVSMVMHGDGILLSVLKRLVANEPDDVVRRRAARALRLLARDKATPLLINDNDLMDALASSALHDATREVRLEAATAFTSCAALVRAPMPQHEAVLESLTTLASEMKEVVPDVVAKALKEQALHPMNRVPMANHSGLLAALATIAIDEEGTVASKGYATSALLDLSTEEANRETMTTPLVLQALVTNALDRHHDMREVRDNAMRTLLNLSTMESNLKSMATHDGLLKAFVQYAATAPESSTSKGAVKTVIMALVPLI